MIFKCRNCGGNVVFNPEKGKMCCPNCDGIDSQEKVTNEQTLESCINCGAPLTVSDYASATKCEHCGSYIIFDERVEGEYRPHLMIPFAVSKNKAKEIMRKSFKKKAFAPTNFLSEKMLNKLEGLYVPFFLYDMNVDASYHGEGVKTRTWTQGETEYTEHSYYDVRRELDAEFLKVPVDASKDMDDSIMDLMEPYDYKVLQDFKEDYMSGFFSEIYSQNSSEMQSRAERKVVDSTKEMVRASITGYGSVRKISDHENISQVVSNYTLMPVWHYEYTYQNKTYHYFINGQTGKVVGTTPVAKGKVFGYGVTVWVLLTIVVQLLMMVTNIM